MKKWSFVILLKIISVFTERPVSGTADFLREPWFIGSLGGVLLLLLITFCLMLYMRRTHGSLRRKTYPPLAIQQMGIPFHSGMQTTTTSLLPDSSAILGRRGVGLANGNVYLGPWNGHGGAHDHDCTWANQANHLKETLLQQQHHLHDTDLNGASPYATSTLAMQKQRYYQEQHSEQPPLYNEVTSGLVDGPYR